MKLLLIPVIPNSVKVSNQSNRLFSISGYPVKKAGKGFMVDYFYSRLFLGLSFILIDFMGFGLLSLLHTKESPIVE